MGREIESGGHNLSVLGVVHGEQGALRSLHRSFTLSAFGNHPGS